MELRQIECFVAVAEEQHFGRAALRVHLSQSALSRQIQRLEADLGTQLFDRSTRGANLTVSGRAFLRDAREVLHWVDRARESAQAAADGRSGTLRLGYVSSASARLLPVLLRAFRDEAPGTSIHLVERFQEEIIGALRAREVDIGIGRGPFADTNGLAIEPLGAEPLIALLPADHRLASQVAVPLTELARESFVLAPRHHVGSFMGTVSALCQSAGFQPRIVEEAEPLAATLVLVAAGVGITIAPETAGQHLPDGVIARPMVDVPDHVRAMTSLCLLWRDGDLPPVADRLRRQTILYTNGV